MNRRQIFKGMAGAVALALVPFTLLKSRFTPTFTGFTGYAPEHSALVVGGHANRHRMYGNFYKNDTWTLHPEPQTLDYYYVVTPVSPASPIYSDYRWVLLPRRT